MACAADAWCCLQHLLWSACWLPVWLTWLQEVGSWQLSAGWSVRWEHAGRQAGTAAEKHMQEARACKLATVSMLWANTSRPEDARLRTAAASPLKSGVKHSTRVEGRSCFSVRTVRAKCSEPPSGKSSLSTDVSTTYPTPHSAIACPGSGSDKRRSRLQKAV